MRKHPQIVIGGSDWLSSWIYDPDTQRFYSKFSVLRDFLSGMRSDA